MANIESAINIDKKAFLTEAFTEFGIAVGVILLRIYARTRVVGFKGWQGDDYFALLCILIWVGQITLANLVLKNGVNVGIPDDARYELSLMPAEYAKFVFGSKCYFAGWFVYTSLIWSLKACTLILFNRITLGLWQQSVVRYNAIVVVLSFIAILLAFFLQCRPIEKNWQIYPDPGRQCTSPALFFYLVAILNMLTDAVLLIIPFPIINRANIPFYRKIGLTILLSSGAFIIIASLLRCVFSLRNLDDVSVGASWLLREGFVASIVVNLPSIYPLFARMSKRNDDAFIFNPPVNGHSVTTCIGMQRMDSASEKDADFRQFFSALHRKRNVSSEHTSREHEDGVEEGGIKVTTTYDIS